MNNGLITLSFGESSNLLALRYFDTELKRNYFEYELSDSKEPESFIDPTLFVGKEKNICNWIMCDFADNIEGITAIVDEAQQEYIEENNYPQIGNTIWNNTKTTKIEPKKNELFNFLKTSRYSIIL